MPMTDVLGRHGARWRRLQSMSPDGEGGGGGGRATMPVNSLRDRFVRAPVVQATGAEFADFTQEPLDLKALRQAALRYAEQHIAGMVFNHDTHSRILIKRRGVKETLQHGSGPQKIQAVACLNQLLEQGIEVYAGPDLKGRPFVIRVFAAKLRLAGQRYLVAIGARQRGDWLFYDHELLEVANLDAATPQSSESPASRADAPHRETSLISIAQHALQGKASR